jgi:hypothetical protein
MQMRKLFLCAGLMTLVGCAESTKPGDLAISITPSAPTLKAGDTLLVTVTVVNISDRDYSVSAKGCPSPFQALDKNGVPVATASEVCTAEVRNTVLEPGGSYTYQSFWTAETVERVALPPGDYLLRSRVLAGELGVLDGALVRVRIVN